ncbi:hypothetical protein FKW77_006283 [Venturia effusa]|uniref:Uncharacterized protein n=1 Tax=Venturia effusa TaxID=50376 RepID=A0A517LCF0_9PEZI|nr:hypothetical protein FKW77_006283 [Venturia effusa]
MRSQFIPAIFLALLAPILAATSSTPLSLARRGGPKCDKAGNKMMKNGFGTEQCMQPGKICVDYCDNPGFRAPCVLNTCVDQMACTNVPKASPVYKKMTSFRQVGKTSNAADKYKGKYDYYEDDMVYCVLFTKPDCKGDKYALPNFMNDFGEVSSSGSDAMASFQCWNPEKWVYGGKYEPDHK